MKTAGLAASLLLGAGLAGAAPTPQPEAISDPGKPLERSTAPPEYAPLPTVEPGPSPAPAEEEREEAAARLEEEVPAPPPREPAPVPPSFTEMYDAIDAPGTGRLRRGRGGHDHVERTGGALLLDSEGRRLEIVPPEE